MSPRLIGPEAEERLDWLALTDALVAGHERAKAEIRDTLLYRGDDTLLSRAAWLDGVGQLVKTATIFPGNGKMGLPLVNGAATLFSDVDGRLEAVVDFHLLTKWKTAGDSLLAARHLARPDSKVILIIGAGTVAQSLRAAYGALFPDARFEIWNRNEARAEALAAQYPATEAVGDLAASVAHADIVAVATMSTTPVLKGAWLQPGTHVDLIGAYRPDMREADDDVMLAGRIFVDARNTTLDHIGELKIPIESGVISAQDVVADFYDMADGHFRRHSAEDITVFKNGGGAHLDLMVARYILDAVT